MKKVYNKPEIMFDSFSMSTNIASNCGTITNLPSKDQCGYKPDRSNNIYFISTINHCAFTEDDGEYNGICYHNPVTEDVLFSS